MGEPFSEGVVLLLRG